MQSKVFVLREPELIPCGDNPHRRPFAVFEEPILPAYAIEFAELRAPASVEDYNSMGWILGRDFIINREFIVKSDVNWMTPHIKVGATLIVHFHGIKDYSRLFPSIGDKALAVRLGSYYEEAEKAFESSAWLSFALMCGATLEGLLKSKAKSKARNFHKIINDAESAGLLFPEEVKVVHGISQQGSDQANHLIRL